MLRDLYSSTGGPGWVDSSNWLVYEPCLSAWFGVSCCPRSHPWVTGPVDVVGQQFCCARAVDGREMCEDQIPVIDSRERALMHCAIGKADSSEKEPSDAPCVIVKLHLANNRLSGRLGPEPNSTSPKDTGCQLGEVDVASESWVRPFYYLQELHLNDNHLTTLES